jgi:hypothetical protein
MGDESPIFRETSTTAEFSQPEAGRVYIFTATWQSDRFVLQPSSYYSPTTRVNAR